MMFGDKQIIAEVVGKPDKGHKGSSSGKLQDKYLSDAAPVPPSKSHALRRWPFVVALFPPAFLVLAAGLVRLRRASCRGLTRVVSSTTRPIVEAGDITGWSTESEAA
jgi:hypothetical protein